MCSRCLLFVYMLSVLGLLFMSCSPTRFRVRVSISFTQSEASNSVTNIVSTSMPFSCNFIVNHFRSNSIQFSPVQSNSVQFNPVQSRFVVALLFCFMSSFILNFTFSHDWLGHSNEINDTQMKMLVSTTGFASTGIRPLAVNF